MKTSVVRVPFTALEATPVEWGTDERVSLTADSPRPRITSWGALSQGLRIQLNVKGLPDTGYATTGTNNLDNSIRAVSVQPIGKTFFAGDYPTGGGVNGAAVGFRFRIN